MAFKTSHYLVRALLATTLHHVHVASGTPMLGRVIERQADLLDSYDYIVVGGGTAGLTVANRLTEIPDVTVLVLEAGIIDELKDKYLVPKLISSAGQGNTWPYTSEPQTQLSNRRSPLTAAKVLGGGSAINGMEFDRGSKGDYDLWGEIIGDEGWSWDGLFPYFKKTEKFTPPTDEWAEEMGITYDMDAHGHDGPIHSSYSPFMYETSKLFIQAARELGLPVPKDSLGGEAIGAFFSPQSLHGTLRERSFARNTYHTTAETRENYHVVPSVTVTKLINEPGAEEGSEVNIVGVEYVPSGSADYDAAEKIIVKASKEVILSAGSTNTPRILQLSGIGSKTLLDSLEIPVLVDLPGVGENFQDHPYSFQTWSAKNYTPSTPLQDRSQAVRPEMASQIEAMYRENRTGPWCISSPVVLGFWSWGNVGMDTALLDASDAEDAETHLREGTHPSVIAGYARQKQLILKYFRENKSAIIETSIDVSSGFASLAKPLSRGYIRINSTNPLAAPIGDYRALTHPLDWSVLIESIRWLQNVWPTAPALQAVASTPLSPRPGMSDTELRTLLAGNTNPSMYHLVGTCAMMKEEEGGCVDAELKVYGTRGRLRVVDASIMPTIPGTHTQSTVYAIAEKASDMIKAGLAK